jgi:hypothetical protein
MERFNRFTDRARKVLTMAQDEAQRFDHNYIGTEHILLGLLRAEDGVAATVLTGMGVELRKARTAVMFIIGRGDRPVVGEVGLTPRAKRVIELAIDEARRLGHDYIGTEHLLLGLVREGEGIAAGVLESFGINLDAVRHEVIRVVSHGSPAGRWPEDADDAFQSTRWSSGFVSGSRDVGPSAVDIAASPLVRVIGLGQVTVDAGISVELIALEIRGAGSILFWRARPEAPRMLGQLRCTVHDDAGTPYEAMPVSWSSDERASRGEIALTPGPRPEATTLQIDVSGFVVPGLRRPREDEVRGSWLFECSLGG